MQPVLPIQPFSIPPDLRKELPDPLVPLRISDRVFTEMTTNDVGKTYRTAQILPTDKEWRFIWKYFHFDKPKKYGIKRIYSVHDSAQMGVFEKNLTSIEKEASSFKPTWTDEPRADQRKVAMERWNKAVEAFSPFDTIESDGRRTRWEKIQILPLWHGSSKEKTESICHSGFAFFGKTSIGAKQSDDPKSTDDGYFGSGIYFTNSARYAADIYSKGHLILAWVSMREPFPVVGDPDQKDMEALQGKGAYKTYNAHYIPVAPAKNSTTCAVYYPCQSGQEPICDEFVVFHKSQALPRFWVELEVELPYLMKPSEVPEFASELIPHLFKMLQHAAVDRDLKLRDVLSGELAILLKMKENDDLLDSQKTLYGRLNQLIDNEGKINKAVRDVITAASSQMAPLPAQSLDPKLWDKNATLEELRKIDLEDFKRAIAQEPINGVLHCNLGRALYIKQEKSIRLLDGMKMTEQQLYLKAIHLDPTYAPAYTNLGFTLQAEASIQLLDGTIMTKQQLYLKTIDLDPKDAMAYNNLGLTLQAGASIQLLDGTKMTNQQLYIKAIHLDPKHALAYNGLGFTLQAGASIQLLDGTKMTNQQLYLKAIHLDPKYAPAYNGLGLTLNPGESIQLLDGTKMTEQQLYLKTIDLDPRLAPTYFNLGLTLNPGESIQLLDGTKMTEQQLFLKSIHSNPELGLAYYVLGTTLQAGESIQLLDGTEMTQQQLFLRSIHLDPTYAPAYNSLGTTLKKEYSFFSFFTENEVSIRLLDGTKMTKQQLYLKAIHLDPKDVMAYSNLGLTLQARERIRLLDGTKMTNQQLYIKAIHLDPKHALAYTNLGFILQTGESIQLPDRTKMTSQQLLLKAIHLDPKLASAYNNLGTTLKAGKSIRLLDGTKMTKQQLFLKSIHLDPTYAYAYYNLEATLKSGESIVLLDGTKMTQQQLLCLKAIDLGPTVYQVYHNLGNTLQAGASIRLLDGTTMTKQQLLSW